MKKSLLFCLVHLLFPLLAMATPEAFCPGGASPDSDVKLCYDFDTVSNCTTGRELTCFTDNGLTSQQRSDGSGFSIQNSGGVRGGYMKGVGVANGTGPGYMEQDLPDSDPGTDDDPVTPGVQDGRQGWASVVNRFYVKFADGHVTYGVGGHGPGIGGVNADESCSANITFEMKQARPTFYVTQNCGEGSFNLAPNQTGLFALKNNKWYLVELRATVDAASSNGSIAYWVDGTKFAERTNVNWGGAASGLRFTKSWLARDYYHARWPSWLPSINFDQFVIVAKNNLIDDVTDYWENAALPGAASGASVGTADTTGPDFTYVSIEPFGGRHMEGDCSRSGSYLNTSPAGAAEQWRNGGVFSSAVTINEFDSSTCVGDGFNNQVMAVTLPTQGSGGGLFYGLEISEADGGVVYPSQYVYGNIRFAAGNNYSSVPALNGFVKYACGANCSTAQYGKFVSLGVDANGYFALLQRDISQSVDAQVVAYTDVAVTSGVTYHTQIAIHQNQKATVWINGVKKLDHVSLPYSVSSWFSVSAGASGIVVGVINFQGTDAFTVYFDDARLGTMSFIDAEDWDAESVPEALSGGSSSSSSSSSSGGGVSASGNGRIMGIEAYAVTM